jgi:antitoxin component YwqK of YwqJK toxin-antitoxin module
VGDTIYLDKHGIGVQSKNEARYYRVVTDYNPTTDNFYVVEYFKNGKKSCEGDTRTVNGIVAGGNYRYYFTNGVVWIKGKENKLFGKGYENESEFWYPNGAVQGNYSFKNGAGLIQNVYDSLGKQEVKDGSGICTLVDYRDSLVEKGQVANGLREGRWLIYNFNGELIAKENYKSGRLTKGYRMLDQTDSTLYRVRIRGDNAAILKRLERQMKKQIKAQFPKRVGIKKDIYYSISFKDDRIWKVELLRDKFMIDHHVKLTKPLGGQEFLIFIRGETPEGVEVFSRSFKMNL